jgi:hypothetical protein
MTSLPTSLYSHLNLRDRTEKEETIPYLMQMMKASRMTWISIAAMAAMMKRRRKI